MYIGQIVDYNRESNTSIYVSRHNLVEKLNTYNFIICRLSNELVNTIKKSNSILEKYNSYKLIVSNCNLENLFNSHNDFGLYGFELHKIGNYAVSLWEQGCEVGYLSLMINIITGKVYMDISFMASSDITVLNNCIESYPLFSKKGN